MVQALDDAIPVFGIRSAKRAGIEVDPNDFDGMCESYVAAILQQHGGRPCYLAGWSLGGKIAFQVAWLLEQRGVKVRGLAMLDTTDAGGSEIPEMPEDLAEFLAVVSKASPDEIKHWLVGESIQWLDRLNEIADEIGITALADMLRTADPALEAAMKFSAAHQQELLDLHERILASEPAARHFAPKPLKAPIYSFWSEETIAQGYPATFWARYSTNDGCVTVPILPGTHYGVVKGENAREISRVLSELLRNSPSTESSSKEKAFV